MNLGIGIDLGGTQIKGAAFDLDSSQITEQKIVPTRDGERIGDEPAFVAQVRDLIHALDGQYAQMIGISAPGLSNDEGTCINFMPGRLDGLENLDWFEVLGGEIPVAVLNDAHAALMGEWWQGAAKKFRDVIMLTLGTGVGGAVVCNDKLLRGHTGRAGHLGHIPIDFRGKPDNSRTPGSLEDFVGNHNIAERSGGKFESTRDLIVALKNGDSDAEKMWDESMRALAAGITGLVNCFDPQAVIIGGGISAAWDEIEPRLNKYLDQFEWRPGGHKVHILEAWLGEWAGVYGAMAFAQDEIPC